MGVLSRLSEWHWRHIVRRSRELLRDPVDFFTSAEHHLRSIGEKLPDVPDSGLRRQVHFQIAFDLLQSLVAREDLGADYDWLFVHAFRICIGKWVSIAERAREDQTELQASDQDEREQAAAASVLGFSALNLFSDDRKDVHKAIESLIETEAVPPITDDPFPFVLFFGAEIAGEMQCTLYRLPYLALLGQFNRPCRPLLARTPQASISAVAANVAAGCAPDPASLEEEDRRNSRSVEVVEQ
jgi:hypothetical protein